jgi:hypothetical protein
MNAGDTAHTGLAESVTDLRRFILSRAATRYVNSCS